jgi:hypothetical protein
MLNLTPEQLKLVRTFKDVSEKNVRHMDVRIMNRTAAMECCNRAGISREEVYRGMNLIYTIDDLRTCAEIVNDFIDSNEVDMRKAKIVQNILKFLIRDKDGTFFLDLEVTQPSGVDFWDWQKYLSGLWDMAQICTEENRWEWPLMAEYLAIIGSHLEWGFEDECWPFTDHLSDEVKTRLGI